MQLHIAIDGQRQGPMSLEEVNARLADGRIPAEPTLAWHEGCPEWIPLWQVAGVMFPIPTASSSTRSADVSEATEGYASASTTPSTDTFSSVIPYRNPLALVGYYLGVFSLIPMLGAALALPAILLGILGLRSCRLHPQAKGKAHAWVGITTGLISVIGHLLVGVFLVVGR